MDQERAKGKVQGGKTAGQKSGKRGRSSIQLKELVRKDLGRKSGETGTAAAKERDLKEKPWEPS